MNIDTVKDFKIITQELCCGLYEFDTNCHIVINTKTKEAIVVDPSGEAEKIIKVLNSNNAKLQAIFITHGHVDHYMGLYDLKEKYNVPVFFGKKDMPLYNYINNSYLKIKNSQDIIDDKNLLSGKEELAFLDTKIDVIHSPGHSKGSICYYFKELGVLFVGDVLFYESVGRTDFGDVMLNGNNDALKASIKNLYLLDDSTIVYCGHGESTTIGHEKQNNPYVKA